MIQPKKGKDVPNFVAAMLQSAQESKEAKPQTRNDVDPAEIEKVMANIKKGLARK
mgnify:CR=1 FL=1